MEREEAGWFRQHYVPGNRWWFWAAIVCAVGAVISTDDVAAICATFAVICAAAFVFGD